MKRAIGRKLNSTRGSGIAEALVGFLISVLSVITLLGVATTTLELIKQGDVSLSRLYEEESAMETFVKSGQISPELGHDYSQFSVGGQTQHYSISATGLLPGNGSTELTTQADVTYCVTEHHHLFGFMPE